MTCENCVHRRPYGKFFVCRHPRTLAYQIKAHGHPEPTGMHVETAMQFCKGDLWERK